MQLIDRSILLGQDSIELAAQAYAIAPWLKDRDLSAGAKPRLVARDGQRR